MYNRYIPQEASYTWVGTDYREEKTKKKTEPIEEASRRPDRWFSILTGHSERTGAGSSYINTIRSGIQALWKQNAFDSGDLLLLLILLLLLKEGEEPELIIALGLVLLLGSGEDRNGTEKNKTGDG